MIGEKLRAEGFLSVADLEARLVDAVLVWRRIEGGRWPFAGDGPWSLVVKDRARDWDFAEWLEAKAERGARVPVGREDLARAEAAIGWLALVPEDQDRRLVLLAVKALAGGRAQVPWRALLAKMGMTLGAYGLQRRYERVMGRLCVAVNRGAGGA